MAKQAYCRGFDGEPVTGDVDFTVANHGSIVLLRGVSPAAEEWIEERVGGEETQTWGDALVVEPRYIGPIVEGLEAEGFVGAVE